MKEAKWEKVFIFPSTRGIKRKTYFRCIFVIIWLGKCYIRRNQKKTSTESVIANPIFQERRKRVKRNCRNAGVLLVVLSAVQIDWNNVGWQNQISPSLYVCT